MSLFRWDESDGEDWTVEQKVAAQQEILGISLKTLHNKLNRMGLRTVKE